ncbi:unnamed protein product [Clonostachys chloroleuca]|uniref:FAD-binding domain-containing protein n=1 Tax=Clonostachys chloroleuca TaxID=1926264 RepID=A0AA35LWM2_9HYPO|nr:unnamed protein product [Clonostachys chloroleuca]
MITLLVLVYGIGGDALRGEYPEVYEAEIVKQHFNDQILDNMTFKDLYDKRIVTALAPLQTHVFEKWDYGRLVTIGDSAHKVDPVTGQGRNGAIESGALLVNALLQKLDTNLNGLDEKQVQGIFAEIHAGRFNRAQNIIQQGYWLQKAFTQHSTMGKLIARYFMPALGSYGVLYGGVEFCSPATSLLRLETPRRPRAVPFEDELPAKSVKNLPQISKLASVTITMCLCALAADLVRLPKRLDLAIDALRFMDISRASILPAITSVVEIASLLAMALVESNRIGNRLTSWVLRERSASRTFCPLVMWPHRRKTCASRSCKNDHTHRRSRVYPSGCYRFVQDDSTSIMIWKNAPIICFMLARSLLPLSSPSGSRTADDEKLKLVIEREMARNMFTKADLPYIRLIHYSAFLVSAATQLINVYHHGSLVSSTLAGKNARLAILGFSRYDDLPFTLSSLILALGAAPLSLRLRGYITTSQSVASDRWSNSHDRGHGHLPGLHSCGIRTVS